MGFNENEMKDTLECANYPSKVKNTKAVCVTLHIHVEIEKDLRVYLVVELS